MMSIEENQGSLIKTIKKIASLNYYSKKSIDKILRQNSDGRARVISKSEIILVYNSLKRQKKFTLSDSQEKKFYANIQKKKIRTISGVTPVAVFTKPFPCPGKCIFCPSDVRMPKSYLSSEPGAMRAERNKFDPYLQTYNRLVAFNNIGHPTDKVELIILGGTWSTYPKPYQVWFVKRCFDAMNDFKRRNFEKVIPVEVKLPYDENLLKKISGERLNQSYNDIVAKALFAIRQQIKEEKTSWQELFRAQKINEKAKTRCIGLTIETRPDEITEDEIIRIRKLGVTKVQIGIQSLNNQVLKKNKRCHNIKTSKKALTLLRLAGFKIHAHWMANLYGSDPENDIVDYKKLFEDEAFKPDEIKIYPCSLIKTAELMKYYKKGLWQPYTEKELIRVLVKCIKLTPGYCRITRMIRDISANDIVVGNRKSNLRQVVEKKIKREGFTPNEIRMREIKNENFSRKKLICDQIEYRTSVSKEIFIQHITQTGKIVGFLRLSFPNIKPFIAELENSALIRELHIYGPSIPIGEKDNDKAQHKGLGKELLKKAASIARRESFTKLSVISAVGTRQYYRKQGFGDGKFYQHMFL